MTSAQRYRATMECKPTDRLVRTEFGFMNGVLDSWKEQGLDSHVDIRDEFYLDQDIGQTNIGLLGWTEPAFYPAYTWKVVKDLGDYEIKRDTSGRLVKYFKGRTQGFMPTYLQHAVKNEADWENDVKHRLDPESPERLAEYDKSIELVCRKVHETGNWLTQRITGQYMYLRALFGPEDVMYVFYDNPSLIHKILAAWMNLNDKMISRLQDSIDIDELFFSEDICYKQGLLISPDMWREFLKPYYLELIRRIQSRQQKRVYIQIDTDGWVAEAIPLYKEIGMDIMSPFECTGGQDVTATAEKYPDLIMTGGIDKQILATTKENIDKHLEHIIPFMRKRSGYIPTADHSVPLEVSLENYRYYRQRMIELGG